MMKESYGRDGLHGEEFSLVDYLTNEVLKVKI